MEKIFRIALLLRGGQERCGYVFQNPDDQLFFGNCGEKSLNLDHNSLEYQKKRD